MYIQIAGGRNNAVISGDEQRGTVKREGTSGSRIQEVPAAGIEA